MSCRAVLLLPGEDADEDQVDAEDDAQYVARVKA
jgi:hypothetical protein